MSEKKPDTDEGRSPPVATSRARPRKPLAVPKVPKIPRRELEAHLAELEQHNVTLVRERTALEQSLTQAIDLYDKVPVGHLTIDRNGIIGSLNKAGSRLLGDERHQPVGKRFSSFLVEADRRPFADFLGRVFTVPMRHRLELTLARNGPGVTDVQAEALPAPDGRSCRLVLVDISERKKIEAEVTRANQELSAVTGLLAVLSSSLDSVAVLNRALRGVLDLTGLDAGSICLLDSTGKQLEMKARIEPETGTPPMFPDAAVAVGDCHCGQSACDLRPVIFLGETARGSRDGNIALHRAGIRRFISVPLTSRKRSLGVLCAYSRLDKSPSAYSIDLVCELGGPIGAVLDNALLFEVANRDLTAKQAALSALAETQRQLSTLIANLPGVVYRCRNDDGWTTEFVSDGIERLTGYPREDFMEHRRHYSELIHDSDRYRGRTSILNAIRAHGPFAFTHRITSAKQGERWVWEQGCGVYDSSGVCVALEGIVIDVTDSKRAEELAKGQRLLLERIASGAPLRDTLAAICRFVEMHATATRVSILLVDETGTCLRVGAAPSMPPEFTIAMEGQRIGLAAPPCGVAAHLGQPVYVADIMTDPQWSALRDLAARLGVRSCSSSPILDEQRKVIGTFAFHGSEAGLPDAWQHRLIALATHVAAIAIERHRMMAAVRESEEKFSLLFARAVFPTVLSRLTDLKIVEVNAAFERVFGYSRAEVIGRTSVEIGLLGDAGQRRGLRDEFDPAQGFREREVEIHTRSGETRTVLVNVNVIELGGVPHLLSTAQDITQRQQAERLVREQLEELQLWHRLMLGREDRIIELKREVNSLLEAMRQSPRYVAVERDNAATPD